MRQVVLNILKHGVPAALLLALVGYVLAEGASMWMSAQPTQRSAAEPGVTADAVQSDDFASQLRSRLPLSMAAWGFGFVVMFEVLLYVWRGGKSPPPTKIILPPSDEETEKLLNELLEKAEAAEASRKQAACNSPMPADNTGTSS